MQDLHPPYSMVNDFKPGYSISPDIANCNGPNGKMNYNQLPLRV